MIKSLQKMNLSKNNTSQSQADVLGSGKIVSFFFGLEVPSFGAFFRTAILRLALFYPFCIVYSNSLTDVWDILLIVAWLFCGQWKERFQIIKGSPILILSVILMFISFVGVFQYETSLFQSFKYWRGHCPIPMLIILGTIFTTKSRRFQMLGAVNLALLTGLTYSLVVKYGPFISSYSDFFKPAHITKNTIWFGMAFVILIGLWICFPYVSRLNPAARPWFAATFRKSMRNAASWPFHYQYPPSSALQGFSYITLFLSLIRWGIIVASLGFIVLFNPSRTAIVAVLLGISSLILLHYGRRGLVLAFVLIVSTLYLSNNISPIFQMKINSTIEEAKWFQNSVGEENSGELKFVGGRLHLYRKMVKVLWKHPLGIGMERTRQKCLELTKNRLDNVHSEFIAIGVQSGFHGLFVFLLWFFFLFRQSTRLLDPWRSLGLYVAVTLFIACAFNGALSQDMEGHLYCILIALIASVDVNMRDPVFSVCLLPKTFGTKFPFL